jgi:hypothetical protein
MAKVGRNDMFGIEKAEIKRINAVAKKMAHANQRNGPGDWGILYLVCGALYGQTQTGKSMVIGGLPSQGEIVEYDLDSRNMSDEFVAMIFLDYIKKWAQDKSARDAVRKNIHSTGKDSPEKESDDRVYYLTLAYMLNSLSNLECEDYNKVKMWAADKEDGWEEVFFGAGLLLSNDKDFHWERYASVIKSKCAKKEGVNELFEYFENKR